MHHIRFYYICGFAAGETAIFSLYCIPHCTNIINQIKIPNENTFEILGIACGDSEEKWKKAVEENKLPWLNVINDEKGGTDVSKIYAVSGYPTKIVIDRKGKILKFITGESPEFYTFLDELFKK